MYKFLITQGHGYLIVPIQEVRNAIKQGLKISPYSALKNNNAYLEEDCDAPAFMEFTGITMKNVNRVFGSFDKNLYPAVK